MSVEDSLRALIREVVGEMLAGQATSDGYLSVGDAAKYAAVSPWTIRAWIKQGRLGGYRAGRVLRVKRVELEGLLTGGGKRRRAETADEAATRLVAKLLASRE